ncbi:MAG: hypothetical protein JJT82_05710 [Legionellaceae bacterium]|nr:hypothetical protein [Legionellaceae bacterium]
MNLSSFILIFFLFFTSLNSSAAKPKDYVLPDFTGEWYISNTSHSSDEGINDREYYLNQCFVEEFVFKKKSANKEAAVYNYMNSLPTIGNCKWKIDEISEQTFFKPETYLSSDWDENSNKIYDTTYYLTCLAEEDGYDHHCDSASIELRPIYKCPENTRLGRSLYGAHCSYKANLCLADVVGRDMNSDYFYWLGHVGLTNSSYYTDDGNKVLEVLKPSKNEDVIQENHFNDFVHSSPSFWGSVYSYHSEPKLTFSQAIDIIYAGQYQKAFEAIYVPFAEYREGGVVPKIFFDYFRQEKNRKKIVQKAAFRCDTFIQYCYHKGANINLKELSPQLMFSSFQKHRQALPVDISILPSQRNFLEKEIECDSAQCFEEKISHLIHEQSKSEDVLFVIDKYKDYLSDNALFNNYLLRLYKEHATSYRKIADNLLDLLVINQPSDSIKHELVDLYLKSRLNKNSKSLKLLSLFKEIFVYDDNEVQEFSTEQIKYINKVNEIIIDILKSSNDMMEVIEAIEIAAQIMDSQYAVPLIFEALKRFPNLSTAEKDRILENLFFYQLANNKSLIDPSTLGTNDFNKRLLLFLRYNNKFKTNKKTRAEILNYLMTMNYRKSLSPANKEYLIQNIGDRLLWLSVVKKLGGVDMAKDSLNNYDSFTRILLKKSLHK